MSSLLAVDSSNALRNLVEIAAQRNRSSSSSGQNTQTYTGGSERQTETGATETAALSDQLRESYRRNFGDEGTLASIFSGGAVSDAKAEPTGATYDSQAKVVSPANRVEYSTFMVLA
jgi:hypothetical protein